MILAMKAGCEDRSLSMGVCRMAVAYHATAYEVGASFADLVHYQEAALQLWVATNRDTVELWLLTHPLEPDQVSTFYEAAAMLYDRFPNAFIRFHLINPRLYETDANGAIELHGIPADADEIPLRRD